MLLLIFFLMFSDHLHESCLFVQSLKEPGEHRLISFVP